MPVIRRNPGKEIKTNEYGKVRLWCVNEREYKEFFPIDAHELMEKGICKMSAPDIELSAPDGTKKVVPLEMQKRYEEKGWKFEREVDPDEIEEAPGIPDAPGSNGKDAAIDFKSYTLSELEKLSIEAGITDIPKGSVKSVYVARLAGMTHFVPSFLPKSES